MSLFSSFSTLKDDERKKPETEPMLAEERKKLNVDS